MLPTQWSELQARVRRFLRTVGEQTLNQDETVSPTVVLDSVAYPPYRSDPRAFVGLGVADGAVAPNRNQVALVLAGGNTGQPTLSCARIFTVTVNARESLPAAAVASARLWASGSTASVPATPNTAQPVQVEPVIGQFGVQPVPVSGGVLSVNTGASTALPTDAIDLGEQILIGAAVRLSATWDFRPNGILLVPSRLSTTSLLPPCVLGVTVDSLDAGGVNPVAVSGHFSGEFFNLYPPR